MVTLTGLFPASVTMYRTVGGGHRVSVGCQSFSLDDTDLQVLATEYSWVLPSGWVLMRDSLLAIAATWRDGPGKD